MGALFLHLKPDEYLKKLYKTKKLVEKTSFSLQAEKACGPSFFLLHHPHFKLNLLNNKRRNL
ncbi:hypothetical protein [Bacillus subtilis]|uniref:hypothetical protein n=1 Tax=Bacillus subtilis TaxID=1423 RepID=UPI00257373B7|nr:hypothetical protein [Bacillus subtilis]MEC0368052.1 hypothetical protein [Bacillus subtilis]MEC0436744.1 hypothetical protein [Bacillus subtilis]